MKHHSLNISKAAVLLLLIFALAACGDDHATTAAQAASTDAPATAGTADPSGATSASSTSSTAAAQTTKINLNTATADDFLTIPGVGSRMVREFMEYRPYTSIQQFRREIGKYVDDQQVAEYEKYVYVPVDVNQADTETLKQLPGVDDAIAADLIAGRPYGSNDDFLARLATHVSSAELAAARSYLATP